MIKVSWHIDWLTSIHPLYNLRHSGLLPFLDLSWEDKKVKGGIEFEKEMTTFAFCLSEKICYLLGKNNVSFIKLSNTVTEQNHQQKMGNFHLSPLFCPFHYTKNIIERGRWEPGMMTFNGTWEMEVGTGLACSSLISFINDNFGSRLKVSCDYRLRRYFHCSTHTYAKANLEPQVNRE